MSAIAVGLVALAGIAVAEIATDDAGTSTMDALVVTSATTMVDDHGESGSTESTTITTMVDDHEYDDEYDDDEYDDDEYDDDEYDDDGTSAPADSTTTTSTTTMDDDDKYDDEYDDDRSIADGFETIDVSPAGSITVEVRSGMLYLTSMDIDSNWMLAKRDEQSEQFELLFYWGESELKIKVEIDSSHLKKMVEFDMEHD
mgnify:CR=1 FL=1